jgi:adenylate cyclase
MPVPMPEEELRAVLTGEHPGLGGIRRTMKRVPSSPRCKLCAAPFSGLGGAVLKHFGYGRFAANPALCQKCIMEFREHGLTGAEIPVTLLFADIRGSTTMGERLRPNDFLAYLDHFYKLGSEAILRHDGLVDKIVGDEVIGLFFGGVSGPDHAAAALRAATALLRAAGDPHATPLGPIPVGAGVHTGEAYVGTTGPVGAPTDFTAIGDVANTAARLASAAAAGELLLSVAAATAAGRDPEPTDDRRSLDIRGRQERIDVIAVRPAGAPITDPTTPVASG